MFKTTFKHAKTFVMVMAMTAFAAGAVAQDPCPCVPLTYTWLAD